MARRKYSFTEILARHNSGQTVQDIDDLMARVAREIIRYGGKGKVSVSLEIKANGEMGVSVEPTVTHSLPKRSQGEAFFYPDQEGDLFREPPPDEADAMLGMGVAAHPTRNA